MLGSYIPLPLFNSGDQTPPICGVPPKILNKSIGVSSIHRVTAPSIPASFSSENETVTVAELFPQGVFIVYV